MTRVFNSSGHALPVTVLEVGPCHVVQLKLWIMTVMMQFKLDMIS